MSARGARPRVSVLLCMIAAVCAATSGLGYAESLSATAREETWVTNGSVSAIACTTDTIYIGGNFTAVRENTGAYVPIDTTTALAVRPFPKVTGLVYASAPDGSGGWYIGGVFTQVGSLARTNLAYIHSDGTVDTTWNPGANAAVYDLETSGSLVYVGGAFTTIAGGTARNRIAALDASTGAASAWNPSANGEVYDVGIEGSTVYAAGAFTNIGGAARNYIGAVSASTGAATAWNPNAGSWVYAVTPAGSTVYIGGAFTTVGGSLTRNYIAAIDAASTGTATSWDPSADSWVADLRVSGSTVYAGGNFSNIGGAARNRIAAIDAASTGTATAFNPNANGEVRAILISGSTVYAGGFFTNIGGAARSRIAALDIATGNALAWNPNANGTVRILGLYGSTLFVGGEFTSIGGGETRNNIAAFDAETGEVTGWNPSANGEVLALATSGGTVYAGGAFTNIGGQARNRLAALDPATSSALTWNPNANGSVYSLLLSGSTLYTGGAFTNIGGAARNYIAALDALSTGVATAWNPNADNEVRTMLLSGSTLYVGGAFINIGGAARNRIAALNTSTGAATAWNPNADAVVRALALSGSTLFVGGQFTGIGGQARLYAAALDTSTGAASLWNPNPNNILRTLAISSPTLYTGGDFSSIGGQTRNRIAALDVSTASATGWDPGANSSVYTLNLADRALYAGGAFTTIGGHSQVGFAQFEVIQSVAFVTDGTPGATLDGATTQTSIYGEDCTTVTANAPANWHFVKWTLDGADYSTSNPLLATNVTDDMTLVANFALDQYTLTYLAGSNGSISGSTPQTVDHGSDGTAVEAIPDTGYHFVNWSDSSTDNPRTDTSVTTDLLVTANFSINYYTVTFETDGTPGASLDGATSQTVAHGSGCSAVTANAPANWHFVNWTEGGSPYSTDNPLTVTDVTTETTLTANFALDQYTLTYTAGANGSISGTSPQTVEHGSDGTAVEAIPNTGYHFVNWSDLSTQNPRTDTDVTGNISVTANFAINQYTLTYTAGANGSISGTSPQTVNYGSDGSQVEAIPNTGYHFVNWSDSSTQNPRTDTNVTASISVTANFAINQYTVTFETDGMAGASLIGTSPQTIDHGSDCTPVTAVAPLYHHFVNWTKGGADYSTDNPLTVTSVTETMTLRANFEINIEPPPGTGVSNWYLHE
ncbi:InlB B-repeat-containing protein [Candidatus Sumerlaeota bacterium]|nr:InlB B-repeat-containing protein [Candidatus Sumerlaeota bacterium]